MSDHHSENVTRLQATFSVIDELEMLLEAAKAGAIIGLCGYAVTPAGRVYSVTTDHGVVNNGMIAYCSVLMARLVEDDSDDE